MSGAFHAQLPTSVWKAALVSSTNAEDFGWQRSIKTCWMAKARALIRIAHVHWRARAAIGAAASLRR
jgi:hypothetical protein